MLSRHSLARRNGSKPIFLYSTLDVAQRSSVSVPCRDTHVSRFSAPIAGLASVLAALPGVTAPPRLRAETLRRLLAYEMQARTLGDLTAQDQRTLRAVADGRAGRDASVASPGTHLVRYWKGRTYRVEVSETGYVLDGTTYASLSAVARQITGTAWSGPRFFGLTERRSG